MDWEGRLKQAQVIWRYAGKGPHALYGLASFGAYNKHSNFYFNSDYMVCQPGLLKEVSSALHAILRSKLTKDPAWIVTYAPYGLNLAFCLADLFDCKLAYIAALDRPEILFDIRPDDAILFCADDLQTGGSVRKVGKVLLEKGAKIMPPLCVAANLSGSPTFEGYEIVSLMSKRVETWESSDCPLCRIGSPALAARQHWLQLLEENSGKIGAD
jgi:orotate phosphoribosyltransferase